MKLLLLSFTAATLLATPPPMRRYRAVVTERQTIDLTSLDEGTQTTERSDTIYAQMTTVDSAGGHLVFVQLDSAAFNNADRAEIPPEEVQQLRGARAQFFLPPDGSAARQSIVQDGGDLATGLYASLLDIVPRIRGPWMTGSTWSDSAETIENGADDYRHARYRTNYLAAPGAELRSAFAGSHARLIGPAEVTGTSVGSVRWTLGSQQTVIRARREETLTLLWKDDQLPAPLPLTVVQEITLTPMP